MKIWKATFRLYYDCDMEIQTRFEFEECKNDYELNEYTKDEWRSSNKGSWVVNRVPKYIKISYLGGSTLNATQGFDKKLTPEELYTLERDMRKTMLEYLDARRIKYLLEYDKKTASILNGLK